MKYEKNTHIMNVEEVKAFFEYLVNERKCNFHPDDDFADYVFHVDKTPMFTDEEIDCFNRLMDECFGVCDAHKVSIYDMGLMVLKKEMRGL